MRSMHNPYPFKLFVGDAPTRVSLAVLSRKNELLSPETAPEWSIDDSRIASLRVEDGGASAVITPLAPGECVLSCHSTRDAPFVGIDERVIEVWPENARNYRLEFGVPDPALVAKEPQPQAEPGVQKASESVARQNAREEAASRLGLPKNATWADIADAQEKAAS